MARQAGRNAAIYIGATTSAAASPLTFQNSWSISFESERIEVTAFGDTNKSYVVGIADASGEFSGFYDDATAQTLTAATDGLSRKFYLYPNSNTPGQYWHGTIFADFKANAEVNGAIEVGASWGAASTINKVG